MFDAFDGYFKSLGYFALRAYLEQLKQNRTLKQALKKQWNIVVKYLM